MRLLVLIFIFYSVTCDYVITENSFCKDSRGSIGSVNTPEACEALLKLEKKDDKGFYLQCPEDGEDTRHCRPCETTELENSTCGSASYFFKRESGRSCETINCKNGGKCREGTCVCAEGWKGKLCDDNDKAPATIEKVDKSIGMKCAPAWQQTFCAVHCGESNCEDGFCSKLGECECMRCGPVKQKDKIDCTKAYCNNNGEPVVKEGDCSCKCDGEWSGPRCSTEKAKFPKAPGFSAVANTYCIDSEALPKHGAYELSHVSDCRELYQNSGHTYGFIMDCYERNVAEEKTMNCQACLNTETGPSKCGGLYYQPTYEKCEPECLNGGICHKGLCHCTTHYTGTHCETKTSADNKGKCRRVHCNAPHGSCDENTGHCQCSSGYTGTFCQIALDGHQEIIYTENSHQVSGWFIFLLIIVGLLILSGAAYFYYRHKDNDINFLSAVGQDYAELMSSTYQKTESNLTTPNTIELPTLNKSKSNQSE